MRIAIVINTSWNIYNFRKGLIQALQKKGFEVIAIAPRDSFSPRLEEIGCQYFPVKISSTSANPFGDIGSFMNLRRMYKKIRPDIILHYTIKPNIYGTLAASSLGIPCINNVSGLGTVFLDRNLASLVAKFLYRFSFNRASLIFFQNKDDQSDFLLETGLKNLNMDLLPGSGVDLAHFVPQEEPTPGNFRFLLVARLIIEKGIFEYVEAAKTLKREYDNLEFQLLGSVDENHSRGISKNELDSWIDQGIINYLGTKDDLRRDIAESTCVVLPSYREGTPKTLLEAAAMGKPIVTCDTAGCREVVEDNFNGLLCEIKNAESLTSRLRAMIEMNENDRKKMGQNGRKLVEDRFDEKLVIDKYLNHISNITNLRAGN